MELPTNNGCVGVLGRSKGQGERLHFISLTRTGNKKQHVRSEHLLRLNHRRWADSESAWSREVEEPGEEPAELFLSQKG